MRTRPQSTPAAELRSALRAIVTEESVVCLDDLLMRRTDWLCDPRGEAGIRSTVQPLVADLLHCTPPAATLRMPDAGSGATEEV